jgi:hypothetical protein
MLSTAETTFFFETQRGNTMKLQYTDAKLTDDLERRLIQREIDGDANRDGVGASVLILEVVVGTLLLVGMLLLAARYG